MLMIILERPFVSMYLLNTLIANRIPVLETDFVHTLPNANRLNLLLPEVFFTACRNNPEATLYSNSEDSASWIYSFLGESTLASHIRSIKDKYRMREVFAAMNPGFYYSRVTYDELEHLDVTSIPTPFVVKPVRGIASIGIRAVFSHDRWPDILREIENDRRNYGDAFSDTVMDLDCFLIEGYIAGAEIAVDAFFDRNGIPVIVNILEHDFACPEDNSDRLYKTSNAIIQRYMDPVKTYLSKVSEALKITNFPMHMEMRISPNGEFIPIEINPMRFAGFCTTDIASYAFNINPYLCFLHQESPDWETILATDNPNTYIMAVVDIPRKYNKRNVEVDYDRLTAKLSHVLELRKMDYHIFPMAAFLFAMTTPENSSELEQWLHDPMDNIIYAVS